MAHYMTDYAATRRDFRLEVPERLNWVFDTFDARARDPSKLALLWVSANGQPRRFTFAELAERSRRFPSYPIGHVITGRYRLESVGNISTLRQRSPPSWPPSP